MAKLTRKRALLAKIESIYGTDPTPTGSANAILCKNLEVNPLEATNVSRDLIRAYLGEYDSLVADKHVSLTFDVEIAGAGAAGTAPAYGPLLRACGMAEVTLGSAATGTAQDGTTTSITLASGASATDDVYVGLLVTITANTGVGGIGYITAYNGTTKVATISSTWTAPDNTSTYSIGAGVTYRPVSASFESATLYYNVDGILHKATGCRGTVQLDLSAGQIPVYKFKFIGIYNAPTDTALPTCDYSDFVTPVIANNTNTTGFSFFGVSSLVLKSMTLDVNNVVDFRALIGSEYVQLTDRRANGEINFEAPTLATFNSFSTAIGTTTGALAIKHGQSAGNIVSIGAPAVDVANPTYNDDNGVQMIKCPVAYLPSAGNDEFTITVA